MLEPRFVLRTRYCIEDRNLQLGRAAVLPALLPLSTPIPHGMTGSYSPALVVASILVAMFASYVALTIVGRVTAARGTARGGWLAGGSVAMGIGIWSMHFIGMLALHLPVPTSYHIPLWMLSAAVAIVASAFALLVVGRRQVPPLVLLFASLLMGAAIAGMHYTGMAAMHIPGTITYDPRLVGASVGIAVVASGAALWLAVRLRDDETRRGQWQRGGAAVLMGAAISGMHYTGMAAARFRPTGRSMSVPHADLLATDALAASVLVGTLLILGIALIAAVVDRELRRRSTLAQENEELYRQADENAQELQSQAAYLQEQAAELELLNDEISAAEARLRGIIDSSLDAVITVGADGLIIDWSRHAETLLGWTAAEAVGRPLTETIIPERLHEAHERGVRRYLETGEGPILNQRIEVPALRRDGTEFPAELTVSAVRWGTHLVFSAFLRDISERRQVEQRLAAEHAVTRILAESHHAEQAIPLVLSAIGAALEWDFATFWSPDAEAGGLRCRTTWSRPEVEIGGFERESYARILPRGQGLPGRVWERGEPVWMEDVTQEPSFPRAAAAVEAGLRGAFAFPIVQGEELLGVMEFFHRRALRPSSPLLEMVSAVGADLGQSLGRMRAEEERDRALAEMARVNVQLQQTNEALESRTQDAERARIAADEANQAKSEFLANMSHELRTPINAVVGYTDLLELGIGGPLTDQQRLHLERIRHSSQHLLSLIEDILDLAKVEAGRLEVEHERGALAQVAESALSLVRPQAAERGLEMRSDCDDRTISYVGDDDRVRQILVNLLSNAVKFTEPGGRITLRCGTTDRPHEEARLVGEGPWACVQVEDTGVGIAPEETAAVFQPFVQAERGRTRRHGGTGLGLTISRQLARLMGGDLTLRSEPGRGSCFSLWLPTNTHPGGEFLHTLEAELAVAGMSAVGEVLQEEVESIMRQLVLRLRSDPETPMAAAMSDVELEDHLTAFLVDVAQTLIVLERAPHDTQLIRDSADLQAMLSQRHGAQRARFRWTEEALRRETQIVREEIAAAVEARFPDASAESALQVIHHLLSLAETSGVRGLQMSG